MIETEAPSALSTTQLVESFARNVRIIGRQVDGLSHADSLLQPPVRGNCLNWVVGHIAVHRDYILQIMGEERLFGEERSERYNRGSAPITGEGEGVLPLETLLAVIDEGQTRIAAALERLTASDLEQPSPVFDSMTVASNITFFNWHETYHVGQTEFLRQLTGVNDGVI